MFTGKAIQWIRVDVWAGKVPVNVFGTSSCQRVHAPRGCHQRNSKEGGKEEGEGGCHGYNKIDFCYFYALECYYRALSNICAMEDKNANPTASSKM